MGCLGNMLWFVFDGAVSGLSWCLAGCLWCITVVGIPVVGAVLHHCVVEILDDAEHREKGDVRKWNGSV